MKKQKEQGRKGLVFDSEKISSPPIFAGFEMVKDTGEFLIRNLEDGSVFKWIFVEKLKANGIYGPFKGVHKAGRRNFQGTVFNCFNHQEKRGYYETLQEPFIECIEKYGGFYISIARAHMTDQSTIQFLPKGDIVDCITIEYAEAKAEVYSKANTEFSSYLPCGAAMDCVYEEVFERFYEEVRKAQRSDETFYKAWNRLQEEKMREHQKGAIYGMFELICAGELTSERFNDASAATRRGDSAHGLYLIANSEDEKTDMTASFPAGYRNFCYTMHGGFRNLGYRVMLLPK